MLLSGGLEISFIGVECRFAVVAQTNFSFGLLHSMLTKLCRLNTNHSTFNDSVVEPQLSVAICVVELRIYYVQILCTVFVSLIPSLICCTFLWLKI